MCKTRMKIAIISRGWWPTIKGGSEKFASKVAEGLYSRGHEVIGVTRWIHGFPKPEAEHELIIMEVSKARSLILSFRFSRWASKEVNELDVDIVLVNSYSDFLVLCNGHGFSIRHYIFNINALLYRKGLLTLRLTLDFRKTIDAVHNITKGEHKLLRVLKKILPPLKSVIDLNRSKAIMLEPPTWVFTSKAHIKT